MPQEQDVVSRDDTLITISMYRRDWMRVIQTMDLILAMNTTLRGPSVDMSEELRILQAIEVLAGIIR